VLLLLLLSLLLLLVSDKPAGNGNVFCCNSDILKKQTKHAKEDKREGRFDQ